MMNTGSQFILQSTARMLGMTYQEDKHQGIVEDANIRIMWARIERNDYMLQIEPTIVALDSIRKLYTRVQNTDCFASIIHAVVVYKRWREAQDNKKKFNLIFNQLIDKK